MGACMRARQKGQVWAGGVGSGGVRAHQQKMVLLLRQSNVVPDGVWELVELALQAYSSAQAPSKAELDAAIQHACRETRTGTYLGSTLRFLLKKHGCPAGA